ncbi:sterol desaturase family protein [Ilumatobacter sp.]|uniref:sterol desaturase family protein n=1 Tax=Ilumatobacter sp. TaxID=1967498 RepID=UPI003AF93FFA
MAITSDAAGLRADDLRTKREIARVYVARGSARVLITAAIVLGAVRLAVAGFDRGDLLVAVVTVAITGTVEWIIHRFLLHAADDAWTSRTLGTGTGHRRHHLDPPDIDWLMLRGVDAAVFITAFGAVTAAWTIPLMWLTRSAQLGPFLTAWTLAAIGLAHYEWVHLMVHTRYRPRTRYYRRLASNHRLHHYRNEHFWLGVTTNTGDRLLRTYPNEKTDVPLSDTARTLAP